MEIYDGGAYKEKFPGKMHTLDATSNRGGRVGVMINGQPRNYFRTYKGLRQGDPLSPMLFNLVGDTLLTMLERAKESGFIRGLVPELVVGG